MSRVTVSASLSPDRQHNSQGRPCKTTRARPHHTAECVFQTHRATHIASCFYSQWPLSLSRSKLSSRNTHPEKTPERPEANPRNQRRHYRLPRVADAVVQSANQKHLREKVGTGGTHRHDGRCPQHLGSVAALLGERARSRKAFDHGIGRRRLRNEKQITNAARQSAARSVKRASKGCTTQPLNRSTTRKPWTNGAFCQSALPSKNAPSELAPPAE